MLSHTENDSLLALSFYTATSYFDMMAMEPGAQSRPQYNSPSLACGAISTLYLGRFLCGGNPKGSKITVNSLRLRFASGYDRKQMKVVLISCLTEEIFGCKDRLCSKLPWKGFSFVVDCVYLNVLLLAPRQSLDL